jgi:uncharacterized protein
MTDGSVAGPTESTVGAVEPVTALPSRSVAVPSMRQDWRDLAFLHWPIAPKLVEQLLPSHVRPDVLNGTTYVGIIGLRIAGIAAAGAVSVPWLGTFDEIHLRLYSVDRRGRRGAVFLALNADRLLTAAFARMVLRVPYTWSATRVSRQDDVITYTTNRRWRRGPTTLRFAVRVGEPCAEASPLDHFVTARWSMHSSWLGRTLRLDTEHPPWPLFEAELLDLDLPAAFLSEVGLPPLQGSPVNVLYSPGVRAKFGLPRLV